MIEEAIMNLIDLLDSSLRGRRDAIGLEYDGRTYTFGEIESRSNRLAQLLIGEGFEPGDRLCVYLANCVEMIDLYLACIKAGIIFVPINILYREREISHILQRRGTARDRSRRVSTPSFIWTRDDLHAGCKQVPMTRPAAQRHRRCRRGHHLHIRHYRDVERRAAEPQQFRGEHGQSS